MNASKSISHGLLTFAAIFLGVAMAISIATNPSGGMVALVPLITALLGLQALLSPRAGLYGIAALVIWVDEFKRLAVYFGGANSLTVIQTLAMPFIVLAALNAGFMLNIMFGKVKMDGISILIYAFAILVGTIVFVTMDAPWQERGQRAASLTGYMTLIPIVCAYLRSFDDWRKFISFQALIALPAAAWAIQQYYFGFNAIEWQYARSGLSRVHYVQMFTVENPRVFGLFGSASALGCAAIYCTFSVWHALRHRKRRAIWWLVGAIYFVALIVSTQRTALIYPFLVIIPAFAFRTQLKTFVLYSASAITFISGVMLSDYMIEQGIEKINTAIAVDSGWGQEVITVSTFSDRFRGWSRLKKPESWSLLGTGREAVSTAQMKIDVESKDYNHDIINKILINYGILGLFAVIVPLALVLRTIHRTILHLPDGKARHDAAFSVALSLPIIVLSIVGGDNFTTNPINLQIWTCFAGVLVCRRQMMENSFKESAEYTQKLALMVGAPETGISTTRSQA